jgi:hypothetical protein
MQSEHDHTEDSFYPYREQEKAGTAEVPILDPAHELPAPHKRISWPVILIGGVILFFAVVLSYNTYARNRDKQGMTPTPSTLPTWTPVPSFTPVPTQKVSAFSSPQLQAAYNQTLGVQTMKAAFISNVHTLNTKNTGEQWTVDSKVEGYLFGTADGNTIQTELRISYSAQPERTAFFGQILVDNRLFMKVNEQDWIERDRSDYNKLYENQPIDATAYAYNMLDTLFTNSKALLRGIDASSIQQEADQQIDGKTVQVYSFNLSVPDYINELQKDPKTTSFTLSDAKKIMESAKINGQLYVDPAANYIVRITLNGSNFTQINTDQSQLLGQTTTHSIDMIANLVEFNAPLSLKAPTN